jgi:cobalt-zinc-cadmium efflux system membrane fusion protein
MKSKILHAGISLAVFGGLSLVLVGLTSPSLLRPGVAAPAGHGDKHAGPGQAAPVTPCEDGCEPDQARSVPVAACEDGCELEHAKATSAAACEDGCEDEHAQAGPALTLAQLRARQCEHGPILECDECRYEAGVARLQPTLAEGLVETRTVHVQDRAARRLELTGAVQLDLTRVVDIAPAGSGRVQEVRRILGDTVQASDVLVTIQSAEFGQAESDYLEALARRDLARQTYEREKQLHERKISSEADYLSAGRELTAAEAAVAAARKRLQLFGLDNPQIDALKTADGDETFGRLVLTAPIEGTVIQQNVVRGQLVSGNDTLYRVADLSRVWIWCDVYESDLAALYERFESGEPVQAEVHVRAFPGKTFEGTVDMIGNELDPETRTLKVRVVAENPHGRLKPGMFVTVSLGLDDVRPVLRVPETAVLRDEGTRFVFVKLADDLWARRDVEAGPQQGGFVEVYNGLHDGETVATRGAFMFKSEVLKEKMGAGCAH